MVDIVVLVLLVSLILVFRELKFILVKHNKLVDKVDTLEEEKERYNVCLRRYMNKTAHLVAKEIKRSEDEVRKAINESPQE